jgi:hypothetical protein
MGRPIHQDRIGLGTGRVSVTRYRFTGESQVLSTTTQAYIVSQNSNTRFSVTDDTTTETLKLVNKTTLAEGEMSIDALLDNSTIVQVTRLHNKTMQYEGVPVATPIGGTKIPYVLGALSAEPGHDTGDGIAVVDAQV